MFSPWVQILIGSLLITSGGVLATKGWSDWSDERQRKSLIQSVAAEWHTNINIVTDRKFVEPDDTEQDEFVVFPRLRTAALDASTASGLLLAERDRELFTRVSDLAERAHDFNHRLDLTELQMASSSSDVRKQYRKKIRDGRTRRALLIKLAGLGKFLIDEGHVKASDTFYVDLNKVTPPQE